MEKSKKQKANKVRKSDTLKPEPPARRVSQKTPDPSYRSKSPDPKKLKRAEKVAGSGSSQATPPPVLKSVATPQKNISRKLSFQSEDTITDIVAENPAPAKSKRNQLKKVSMTEAEADAILQKINTEEL